ncbi:class I SAM-dependent methyltransferase [Microbacterium kyungheense]|uniref:Methyltransferase family protein n=1 Tax=Microbacterium kyungheense TaxID=1263636 RepID=A0A543F3J4_9MICO|nr:methyltransferase domain-containing protein [Microbacterium kyungheense]TQM28396.1 methyltransferase family protein [Microbacterium kyungheense]
MGGFGGVSAEGYAAFMGRFSTPLAVEFADLGLDGVPAAARVLDVGSGPGMLTLELARRRGAESLAAVDPEPVFVAATAQACHGVDARVATAEDLPFADAAFGAALAQLVVHFMTDPVRGVAEMARVTTSGGRVGACVWDHGGGSGPLSAFWRVATVLDPDVRTESALNGASEGQLVDIFERAGLHDVTQSVVECTVSFRDFDDWWTPFLGGVGPAGRYVATLDAAAVARLEGALRDDIGDGPFAITARAWAAVGLAG